MLNTIILAKNSIKVDDLEQALDTLQKFALVPDFIDNIALAFGNEIDLSILEYLRQQWASGYFEQLPKIEIRPAAEINQAYGAFSSTTNTIYLSQEYVNQNASNPGMIANVLLEEIGHFIDSQINLIDAPGDEGEIFAALVQGKPLESQHLQQLKTQDDSIVINIDGHLFVAEAATNPPEINLGLLAGSIKPLLDSIKSTIQTQSVNNLPLLGDLNLRHYVNDLITEVVEQRIKNELDLVQNKTVQSIKEALFKALGPTNKGGLGLLQDLSGDGVIRLNEGGQPENQSDIRAIEDTNSISFLLKIGKDFSLPLNMPRLGLSLKGDITPNLNVSVTIGFGVDTDAFFIDTKNPGELTATIKNPFVNQNNQPLNFTGNLGLLQIKATDNGSNLSANFSADITSNQADANGRVRTSNTTSLTVAPDSTLKANADLKLKLNTELLNGVLPSISSEFNVLGWTSDSFSEAPTIAFNKVALDPGSFVNKFLAPILDKIDTVSSPFKPLVKALDTRLPLINNNLIELAQFLDQNAVSPGTRQFIKQLSKIQELAEAVKKEDGSGIQFALGDFVIVGGDVRNTPINTLSAENTIIKPQSVELVPLSSSPATSNNFIQQLRTIGFGLPILDDGKNTVNLLLGKQDNVSLVTYNTPDFQFRITDVQFGTIPVLGPFGIAFGASLRAKAGVQFGFDTEGLLKFAKGSDEQRGTNDDFTKPEDIFDGFYASKPDGGNNLLINGELNAKAVAEAGIVQFGVGGGLNAGVNFDLKGENGKVRASTISSTSPLCLFEPNGSLSLVVFGSIKVRLGFFSVTKRLDFARVKLMDFSKGCSASENEIYNAPFDPVQQSEKLAAQGLLIRRATSSEDNIRIRVIDTGGEKKEGEIISPEDMTLFGLDPDQPENKKQYSKVSHVVIYGGQNKDTITLESINVSSELYGEDGDDELTGGNGDDFLVGGQGADSLNGGGGVNNTASYADTKAGVDGKTGVRIDLLNPSSNTSDAKGDTLENIQQIEGSRYDDTIIGNINIVVLDGGLGNDTLIGGNNDNNLLGGRGADTMDGQAGHDSVSYFSSDAPVYVNQRNKVVSFTNVNTGNFIYLAANRAYGGEAEGDILLNIEKLQGSYYDDILVGSDTSFGDKPNELDSLDGNDIVLAGAAPEILDGGEDTDWISYWNSDAGVKVDLQPGVKGIGGYAQGDSFKHRQVIPYNNIKSKMDLKEVPPPNIIIPEPKQEESSFENLEGSFYKDILSGDLQNNIIRGLDGDDNLLGEEGDDTLIGGAGGDDLNGGINNSTLRADLTIELVQAGNLGGGDTASYQDSSNFVIVNLFQGIGSNGDAEGDTFTSLIPERSTIENLIGSKYGDRLTGDAQNNDINPGLSSGKTDFVDGSFGTDSLTLDYSANDYGKGITGGFQNIVNGSGLISRNTKNGSTQDAVEFVNIERLFIVGTIQNDTIIGGSGSDVLLLGAGDDSITGGDGDDLLDGSDGNDILIGGFGKDQLMGGDGDDVLIGTNNAGSSEKVTNNVRVMQQSLPIPQSENILSIPSGNGLAPVSQRSLPIQISYNLPENRDTLTGGAGADKFILGDQNSSFYTNNNEHYVLIKDFNQDEGDIIQLYGQNNRFNNDYYLLPNQPPTDSADVPIAGFPEGVFLYSGTTKTRNQDDLIAIIQGNINLTLTGTEKYFSFVGPPPVILR
ncbi:hypothetical protein F7734_45530 [Scytonema sp. UIC 10036]|uniref:hypothetical protein n=1 Tax=Scytonema sp. UIC 10036 TaxID=2304196 RepID=UPI0012DABFE0|nr:hypothetical protein [Scytonema sp. UIC 10036]MUG99172.1 hypothetical protein [Scytonema sp. UIC 10036]